jgi:hypothetical protein
VTWDAIASNAAANDVRPIVATVKHDPRVAAWTTCWTGAPLRAEGTAFEAIALPLPGGTPFIPAPVTGRLPRTSREIALGTKTLRELHARIGTTIGVSLDNSPPRPMTIMGTTVFPSLSDKLGLGTGAALTPSGGAYLLLAKATMPPPGDVLVRFRAGISPQAGRHALAAQLTRLGSFTVDGPATPTDLVNFGQVQKLPQALGTGLAAAALLTIAHLLMTSARRRQRDVAILRAFGFTPRQVRRTFRWQAVTLARITLVVGIQAGIACGRLCWQVFARQLGIAPVTAVPLAALSIMAASWLAAAAVIAALPGKTATRDSPARVLHSE